VARPANLGWVLLRTPIVLTLSSMAQCVAHCTSKVLIDRLGCEQVWALDVDFRQMGYEVRP